MATSPQRLAPTPAMVSRFDSLRRIGVEVAVLDRARLFNLAALERANFLEGSAYGMMYSSSSYGMMYYPMMSGYPAYGSYSPYSSMNQGNGATTSSGSSGSSAYGGSADIAQPYAQQPAAGTAQKAETALVALLNVSGVPNENGRLVWPLGLRNLPPSHETDDLRKQVEGFFEVAALDFGKTPVQPELVREARQAVDKLHHLLHERRWDLPETSYRDSVNFLNSLETALKAF